MIRALAGVLAATAVLTAPQAVAQPDRDDFVRNVCHELSALNHTRADLTMLVLVVMRDNPDLTMEEAANAVGYAIVNGCPQEQFWVTALAPAKRMELR